MTKLLFFLMFFAAADLEDIQGNNPLKPYLNATSELRELKFDQAIKWFDITIRDFPKSDFANYSKVQIILIYMSYELAYLRLKKLWLLGEKNILEIDENLTRKKKIEFERKIKGFDDQNKEFRKKFLLEVKGFIYKGLVKEITLSFSLLLSDWDISLMRKEVEGGVLVTDEKSKEIEIGEIIINYLGLLQSLLNTTFVKYQLNPIHGDVDLLNLYLAFGSRLYLIGKEDENRAEYFAISKKCLEYALEVSKNNIYRKEREKAKEYLGKVEKASGGVKIDQKICPKCRKVFKRDFIYCPVDGEKLKIEGEQGKQGKEGKL